MTPAFERFVKNPWPGRMITFDPGQTTGWSQWDNSKLTDCGQLKTFPVRGNVRWFRDWLNEKLASRNPHRIPEFVEQDKNLCVFEEYRIYGHMTDEHAHSNVHTLRWIGVIEALLDLRDIPQVTQGAGIAKKFATDEKLKDWGMWQRGERHARDAIRHGVYFLCHGKPIK